MRLPAWAVFLSVALLAAPAAAGSWRLRAREHYESGYLNHADTRGDLGFHGFLSAFDLFWEDPFKTSYGLTVHRGSLGRSFNESVTVTRVGAEVKHFPTEKARLWFVRGGLLGAGVDPASSAGDYWLWGPSVGTGVEFPLWRLGLAPEVGGQFQWGSRGKAYRSVYVALGVHFYIFKGDKKPSAAAAP